METIQQQLNALQTSVKRQRFAIIALAGIIVAGAFVAAVRPVGDATFDKITCKGWKVVDGDGKQRIAAATLAGGQAFVHLFDTDRKLRISAETFDDGTAGVKWYDKEEKVRIKTSTFAEGDAIVQWRDKDGMLRILAGTYADGQAGVQWFDKNKNCRIAATTSDDGTVILPTQDLNPPKKP